MKFKINFGKDGLKGFLARHAEKGIFGVVLALVAVFVFSSATQQGADPGKTPEQLRASVGRAKTNVTRDNWDKFGPDRVDDVDNYPERVGRVREKLDPAGYNYPKAWDPPVIPPWRKRLDPELSKPEQVQAEGGIYAVAFRAKNVTDPFAEDKDAVAKPEEKPKPKPPKKKPRRGAGGGSEMYGAAGDMYGGEMYGASGMPPGMPGSESEASGPSMATGYGMGTAGGKKLGSSYMKQYIRGFTLGAGGGMMPGGGMSGGGVPGVVAKTYALVAVKALVPFEKQWEAYERALKDATGYSAAQDIPRYLWYEAERAEVPEDPNAPLEWKLISRNDEAMRRAQMFAGFPPEVADEAYLIPGYITMPIPPILLKPYDTLALHPEIPKKKTQQQSLTPGEETKSEEEGAQPKPDESPELTEGVPVMPKAAPGQGGFGPGYPGAPTGMPPGMAPGMSSDAGSYAPGSGAEMYGGMSGYGGMPGYGGEMPGYGSGMPGYGSNMPGYGQPGMQQPLVKYKLVRFFDFTAESGKSYVYRVRVVLEDPNRPIDPTTEPNTRILDSAVVERLAKVAAADQEISKKNEGKPFRTYFLRTDWSDPSQPVTLPKLEQYVAGAATAGRKAPISLPTEPKIEVDTVEPEGKMVTSVWDVSRATDMAALRTVYRGSYLDFTQDVEILHPLTLQIKTAENYALATDAFVIDLRGGEEVLKDKPPERDTRGTRNAGGAARKVASEGSGGAREVTEEKVHFAPGEFLVVDGDGNLLVRDEISDTEEYRRLLFIEDAPAGAMPSGMMAPQGMPSDYGGMMDYFGAPGDSGSGSRGS